MRELARQAGVSHATVSRALRNDVRISAAVRQCVRRTAQKLGYRRDAKLSALMTHLRGVQHRTHRGTLAWLTDHNLANPEDKMVHDYYRRHATASAAALGFKLDIFTSVKAADAPRLARTLRARGIQGVILQIFGPFNVADWPWNWNHYAVVHSGSLPADSKLDIVDADDNLNNVKLLETLMTRGHRHIGVATLRKIDSEVGYSLTTARQRFASLYPEYPAFPVCWLEGGSPADKGRLARWIKKYRVDCIVSQVAVVKELVESLGYRVPQDISLAFHGVGPTSKFSGIFQRENQLAALAIETVINSLELGRFGLPAIPRQILIPGIWHQGETTR
jgi:DNA-binding LacI/PurR family transcriptional regulator